MPLITTELSKDEFAALQAHQKTMQAKDVGVVVRAALAAFNPPAQTAQPAAPPAPHSTPGSAAPVATGTIAPSHGTAGAAPSTVVPTETAGIAEHAGSPEAATEVKPAPTAHPAQPSSTPAVEAATPATESERLAQQHAEAEARAAQQR